MRDTALANDLILYRHGIKLIRHTKRSGDVHGAPSRVDDMVKIAG